MMPVVSAVIYFVYLFFVALAYGNCRCKRRSRRDAKTPRRLRQVKRCVIKSRNDVNTHA